MERIRLRVKVVSLSDMTHLVVTTAVDHWTGELLAQWSRVYRPVKKPVMLPEAVLEAVAECKRRFPEAVVNPLNVIDPK